MKEHDNDLPVHPGRILKRELEARNLSAAAPALKLRIAPQRMQKVVAGRRAWLAMQASHDLATLRASIGPRIEAEVEAAA